MISICIKILHLFGGRLFIGVSMDGGLPEKVWKYMGWGHFWAFKLPKKLAHSLRYGYLIFLFGFGTLSKL